MIKNFITKLKCRWGFHHKTTYYHKKHPCWGGRDKMRVFCMNCMKVVWIRRRIK